MSDLLSKWFSPNYLRTLLLDSEKNKSTCIQIARFVAAYYLDYLLYLPPDEGNLPSLYLWGNIKSEDLTPEDVILDRVKVSSMLPVEFSPALPALLMVKCDCLIEAISYVDHFDDRRTSIILRLLADSLHEKELTTDYIKSMIMDNLPLQMEESGKNNSFVKFGQTFTESILQLDVAMQNDLVVFLEQHLISSAEIVYSELPLEAEEILPNPVYEHPGKYDSEESQSFSEIYGYIQILLDSFARSNRIVDQLNFTVKLISNESVNTRISTNYTLHRVLLLMLRLTYRHLFSVSLRENDPSISKVAERYKFLLREEDGEHVLLQQWFSTAEEEEMERVQSFIDLIQNNYQQNSSLPPLHPTTRELWLRRIVLNSTTNHRDIRQERTMDWFRSVCHPKHRVCDVVMSQMLFINSQWTSPGFTFIQPGCLALRLSIHPHDLCLGTTSTGVNFSASARDILYSPRAELENFQKQEERLFTPRVDQPASPDLISKYAQKHNELKSKMAQTARLFNPFEEQMRIFTIKQDELQRELDREREFLSRSGDYYYPQDSKEDLEPRKHDVDLARQLNMINEKLDAVVKDLANKEDKRNRSMYIREEDEESETSELPPLFYEEAPVTHETPVIEKLDFGLLSSRTPVPQDSSSIPQQLKSNSSDTQITQNGHFSQLSTAKSFSNPMFSDFTASTKKIHDIPVEWMKLIPLPLEPKRERFADNLLIYTHPNEITPRATPGSETILEQNFIPKLSARQVVSERGVQTKVNGQVEETQTSDRIFNASDVERFKKVVDLKSIKRLSQNDIQMVLDRAVK